MRSRLLTPIALVLIGLIALLGLLLSQEDPPAALAPASSATRPPITPRLPGNATTRVTATPRSAIVDAAPLPTASPPAPDSNEPLPPLVFARDGQIWRSDGSGAAPTQLTDFATTITPSHPAINPIDGSIAFVALIQPPITATLPLPTARLYTMDADGANLRDLWAPEEGILWLPSWAPDGQSIFVHANGTLTSTGEGGASRLLIVRVDLAGGEPGPIVAGALDPTVSPDGTRLAYLKFDDDGITMRIETSDLDGGNPRAVLDGQRFLGFYAPRFTPDGTRIIVAGIEGPSTDDRGYPIENGAGRGPLESLLALLEPPAAEAHGAPWDLWEVAIDGSGLRRLTRFSEDLPMAAFAPDGRTIAIMAYNGIYLMDADGANLRRIDPNGDHGGLAWAGK